MPCNFSREKQKRSFCGGAAPSASALWRSRSVEYAAKRRTKTDNRREAAAEGRERGSDNFFIQAKVVERGSERRLVREHTIVAEVR